MSTNMSTTSCSSRHDVISQPKSFNGRLLLGKPDQTRITAVARANQPQLPPAQPDRAAPVPVKDLQAFKKKTYKQSMFLTYVALSRLSGTRRALVQTRLVILRVSPSHLLQRPGVIWFASCPKEHGHHRHRQSVQRSAVVNGEGDSEHGNEATIAGMFRMPPRERRPRMLQTS